MNHCNICFLFLSIEDFDMSSIYIYRVYNSICLLSFGITGHQGAIYT